MEGWNRGDPQPDPEPKGYLSRSEPHEVRQEGWSVATVHGGTKREMRMKMKEREESEKETVIVVAAVTETAAREVAPLFVAESHAVAEPFSVATLLAVAQLSLSLHLSLSNTSRRRRRTPLVSGVKNVEVDLSNQVVRILGYSPVKTMTEALEQQGENLV
ncbi:hypothetical protein QYF36_017112 [Acer negundo]|nr:hypothetical protein QYF36_017112 [Acer negundo]